LSAKFLPMQYPPVDNIARHAFLLSALLNNPESLGWLYSNFIQLTIIKDGSLGFISNNTDQFRYRWLDINTLTRDVVKRWITDVAAFVKASIDQDFYFHANVNEFHIPGTASYQKKQYTHNMMVHGYDDQYFYLAGYFSYPHKYMYDQKVTHKQFEQAFWDVDEAFFGKHWQVELFRIPPNLLERYIKRFDVQFVRDSLQLYVNSEPQFPTIFNSNAVRETFYGLQIYDRLIEYLDNPAMSGRGWSARNLQALCNHKALMLDRILYMDKLGNLDHAQHLADAYNRIKENCLGLRNIMIKFTLTGNMDLLHKARQITADLRDDEKTTLQLMLDSIK